MRLVVGAGLLALAACAAGEQPRAVERSPAPVRPSQPQVAPVTLPEAAVRAPDQTPDAGALAVEARGSAREQEEARGSAREQEQNAKPAPCSRKRRRGERSERCLDDADRPIDPNEF
jgi:hypothetical protein